MGRKTKKLTTPAVPVTWLSETNEDLNSVSNSFIYYTKFRFKNIVAEVGDFVLVSNADSAEPDTEEGCDAARIVSLYEDPNNHNDPFRAKVQWYSKPSDLPSLCHYRNEKVDFLRNEIIEDTRPFSTDVSIETFFEKCTVTFTLTKDTDRFIPAPYHYICRYCLIPLSKRLMLIEPVMKEERSAIQMLCTPRKFNPLLSTPKTPTSLIKRMARVSLSEHKNWSVSKREGTKLLFRRDNTENDSPKTPIKKSSASGTPVSTRELIKETNCTMELQVTSENEPNTLIIRQHGHTTPKKQSISKIIEQSPITKAYSTRSGQAAKNKINYVEDEISPVKKTPRRSGRATVINNELTSSVEHKIAGLLIDDTEVKRTGARRGRKVTESDDDFEPIPTTPKTPRTPRTSRSACQTPKLKVSRKNISQLTPSLQSRAHSVESISKFKKDKSLPGREYQMNEILSFVRSKIIEGSSGCMYISGVPGTGKTATVCSALKILKDEAELPDFQLIEINGMKIAEPRQAYVQIYKQLTGKTVVWEQACSLLTKKFTSLGPRRTPTVLVADELDALCTRRQDVLYSIMEWAAHNTALLTVLAVANTMDLPERALAARVASRLGLTRLTFPPYTHTQLQAIVATRLAGAKVNPDAIQLIARKVAAVSGDARRAIALSDRASELAAPESVGLDAVQRALAEASSSGPVTAIRHCSAAERLILRAMAAEVERTGTDETILSRILATAGAIVALDGRPYKSAPHVRAPTSSQALAICARLASQRLLLMEHKPGEPRLLLNVSVDDVYYATKLN